MDMEIMPETRGHRCLWYVCLIFFVFIIYSNSFDCGWHFDDLTNILNNSKIKIASFDFKSIWTCIQANPVNQSIRRPISFLSFGLNWRMGGDNVFGYHLFNVLIHIFNSILLYKIGVALLEINNSDNSKMNHMVAALSATLWAIHPIQIQAVTYIVQRMASLSAMFYLLSLLMFLEFRRTGNLHRYTYLLGAAVCALFSFWSKENGILVLISFYIVELIFYYDTYSTKSKYYLRNITYFVFAFLIVLFLYAYFTEFFSYKSRSFTQFQRLLTQPRVLFFYLGLIFYPVSTRYSIIHDYEISGGLFHPLTTVSSIVSVVVVLLVAIVLMRKYKLLSFAIIFYFINHSIESTIVPLEMVYEHRNYIPSMFLFFPLAKGVVDYLQRASLGFSIVLSLSLSLLMIFVGMATYTRNMDWKTDETLWQSALSHAPDSARVYQNLSVALMENNKISLDEFIKVNQFSYGYRDNSVYRAKYVSLYNQIRAHKKKGEIDKAVELAEVLDHIEIGRRQKYLNKVHLVELCFLNNDYYRAQTYLTNLRDFLDSNHRAPKDWKAKFLELSGVLSVKFKNYEMGFEYGKELIQYPDSNYKAFVIMAYSLIRMKQAEKARHYLQLIKRDSQDIFIEFILENEYLKLIGDKMQQDKTVRSFVSAVSFSNVQAYDKSLKSRRIPIDDGYSLVSEIQKGKLQINDLL